MSAKRNYYVVSYGVDSTIVRTDERVNGKTVFATLAEARTALLTRLRAQKYDIDYAIRHVRDLRDGDVHERLPYGYGR